MLLSSPSETFGCQREALNANPELRVIGSNSIDLLMLLAQLILSASEFIRCPHTGLEKR
jgi:hypothetical protein